MPPAKDYPAVSDHDRSVRRIKALFEIVRSINGKSAEERHYVRRTLSRS